MDNEQTNNGSTIPRTAYLAGSLVQFALGLHGPFLSAYVRQMGANYAELGAFRSVGNIAPTILQPVWGPVSDRIGHRKVFVAFGTLTGLVTVALFLWTSTPTDMIVLYAVQSILFSIQTPAWTSLIGGLVREDRRGIELGRLGVVTNLASLLATIVTGVLAGATVLVPLLRQALGDLGPVLFPVLPSDQTWKDAYYLPFYLTAVFGIAASLFALAIKEKTPARKAASFPPVLKLLSRPGDFRRFCGAATFFSFGMSMAWPYFVVVQLEWLGNTLFEIAVASALMTLTTVILSIPFGKLSDRIGRKPLIIMGRALLVLVPLLYALVLFVPSTMMIYVSNLVAGVATAASGNASVAYVYDISPEHERGSHVSVYNVFTGFIFLLGSFVAGILGDLLQPTTGPVMAAFAMLMLSSVLRAFGSMVYTTIREPREYTSSLWREVNGMLHRRRHDMDGPPHA
ncbi:MAG: MFS transporter [Candidatus Thorarchaeota archaeon]